MALSTAFSALPTSPADVRVVTADGSGIRAHSSVLVSEGRDRRCFDAIFLVLVSNF